MSSSSLASLLVFALCIAEPPQTEAAAQGVAADSVRGGKGFSFHDHGTQNEDIADIASEPSATPRLLDTRHASVHLKYSSPLPAGTPVQSWYNSVVPKHSSESTFFATNGFSFGYAGLQQVEDRGIWFQGTAIFSIWDQGCNHMMDKNACPEQDRAVIIECGEKAICDRFGGEGTGVRSRLAFDEWELEQSYDFLVQAFFVSPGIARYEGYVHANELGGWQLISKIKVLTGTHPWYVGGTYSFVEQWDTDSFEDTRWGRFGPAFVESTTPGKGWTQVKAARYEHTSYHNEVTEYNHATVTNDLKQWGMGFGMDVVQHVSFGQVLTVSGMFGLPGPLQSFVAARDANNLPCGCAGGTCTMALVMGYFRDAFCKTYFPITCLVAFLLCFVTGVPLYRFLASRLGSSGSCPPPPPPPPGMGFPGGPTGSARGAFYACPNA